MKKQNTPILVKRKQGKGFEELSISERDISFGTNLHWHDHYEMEIVLKGSGSYLVNGMQYPLRRGSVYFVTPADFHQLSGDLTIYNIAFDESMLSKEAAKLLIDGDFATVVHYGEEEFDFLELLTSRLLDEFEGSRRLRLQAERALLETILIGFLRRIDLSVSDLARSDSAVMRVVAYIKFNFKKKLTLAEVAREVNLTPNYVGEIFLKKMGVSFNQYLMQTRLNYAKSLLARGEVSVQEAARDAGFGSQTYFSDCFKRAFGYPPSAAIKKNPA